MGKSKTNAIICTVFAFVVTAFVFLIVYFKESFYLNNDDIVMRNIVNGFYTGKPDAHCVFMMYSMGLLLKMLYTLVPRMPWYGAIMIFLVFLCFFLIVRRVGAMFSRTVACFCGMFYAGNI